MAHPLPIESAELTNYDRANVVAYIKLLDAVAEGVDWRAATTSIFGVDAGTDESLARQVFDANLARARWMTRVGYRLMLASPRQNDQA